MKVVQSVCTTQCTSHQNILDVANPLFSAWMTVRCRLFGASNSIRPKIISGPQSLFRSNAIFQILSTMRSPSLRKVFALHRRLRSPLHTAVVSIRRHDILGRGDIPPHSPAEAMLSAEPAWPRCLTWPAVTPPGQMVVTVSWWLWDYPRGIAETCTEDHRPFDFIGLAGV